MKIIDNVTDKRRQWIGSWEVEPLVFELLCDDDRDRQVIYTDGHGRAEAGVLKGWGINGLGRYADAAYHLGDTTARAHPDRLWFGTRAVPVEEMTSAAFREAERVR